MKIAEGKNLISGFVTSHHSSNIVYDGNSVKLIANTDKDTYFRLSLSSALTLGKKYTMSFKVKGSSNARGMFVFAANTYVGTKLASISFTGDGVYKFTFNCNQSDLTAIDQDDSTHLFSATDAILYDFKLEIGEHATQGGKIALGNKNYILNGECPISGGTASGIVASVSTFQGNRCWKVVSSAGNGNWNSIAFTNQSTSTSNIGAIPVGSKVSISMDVYIESGNGVCPTLFLNSGNSYASFTYDNTKIGEWQRVKQTRTWNTPGTNYGNFSPHLGFSSCIGTYYFKNFKLELGAVATPFSISTRNIGNICDLLPSQYVRVEYLESDGLELIQVPTRFSTNNYMISGELSMSTKSQRQLWGNQSGQWYDMNDRDYGGVFSAAFTQIYRSTFKPSVDVRYKFEATATYAKLGDAVITGNLTSIPTYLGLFRIIGYPNFNFTGRVYSYEASEQGTSRVKLIPCIRKSDSKPGMYDSVSGDFYTNQGSGEFLTGPILL